MLWDVTRTEADAQGRTERPITYQQKNPTAYIVCKKAGGKAIGFAGIIEIEPGTYEDCGIALGPEYTGKGYGKQILSALVDTVFHSLGAHKFICSCRPENEASRRLQLSCGFRFSYTGDRIDPRTETPYILEFCELEKHVK